MECMRAIERRTRQTPFINIKVGIYVYKIILCFYVTCTINANKSFALPKPEIISNS